MDVLVVAATVGEVAWVDDAEALVVGIGPVEAAVHVAARLAADPPDAVLHLGIAGARADSGLGVGDVVIGTESRYADLAAELDSLVSLVLPDATLLERVAALLPAAAQLPIATTARVGGGGDGCPVEAMEGFAVLRAAAASGVPAIEIRAISNLVEERDRARWDVPSGLRASAAAGRVVLDGLRAR